MRRKKILFTGASGFLGENIYHFLSNEYEIDTLGQSDEDTYNFDISKKIPPFKKKYDIVLHAAGMVHNYPKNEEEEKKIFDINVQGTKNLCYAIEESSLPESIVFISSVAVYGLNFGNEISEDYPLNGHTPYAISKIKAEIFLQEWCRVHKINLGIIRPSLIAGKNPPGNLGAMIRGIKSGQYLRIGDGKTKKSVLMAEDIARVIPKLTEKGGIYNLCDDHNPSFLELENLIANQLGKKNPISIPLWIAKGLAFVGDIIGDKFPINSLTLVKMVNHLTFSNERAKRVLDWQPLDVLSNFKI